MDLSFEFNSMICGDVSVVAEKFWDEKTKEDNIVYGLYTLNLKSVS